MVDLAGELLAGLAVDQRLEALLQLAAEDLGVDELLLADEHEQLLLLLLDVVLDLLLEGLELGLER